jgi:hypothetical protein
MPAVKKKINKNHITRIKRSKSSRLKGVNTLKYCGKIKLKEDPLDIQNKLRNEWQ